MNKKENTNILTCLYMFARSWKRHEKIHQFHWCVQVYVFFFF